jgi:uncharacterized membrane protein YgdD (TMEM256/DUF423 family)
LNERSSQKILVFTAFLGAMAIAIGAFGAHGLKPSLLANGTFDTFETAVRYQHYGIFSLLIFLLLQKVCNTNLSFAIYLMLLGTIVFSGSLYVICFLGIKAFGMVAPVGGLALMGSWVLVAIAFFRSK